MTRNRKQRHKRMDSMDKLVREVVEAMADPQNLVVEEEGMVCLFCDPHIRGWYVADDRALYPHKAGCPVLTARKILENEK